ncbi:hypothetical protein NX722_17475 [Endozoicomonas gorgoniicola]|uniref:Cobalt transporter n=1 Tax=Endozoicomonas gorgoniicola TaxID=1234144 RepID=A0ABT3MYD8_9GAMM|nr:hypothetical protein [Endozoicomonas gorgoniicola]MCW7554377.1 hypothetical protein [Endozoicomonas gorgoniicola]
MNFSIANILRRVQRHTAVVWLLMCIYITGASYANIHIHKAPADTAGSFNEALHQFYQALEHDDHHHHHLDNDAHDCSACKFQFSHPIPESTRTATIQKAEISLTTRTVRCFYRKTPTKRLTRAPPVV